MKSIHDLLPTLCTSALSSYTKTTEGAYISPDCAVQHSENIWNDISMNRASLRPFSTLNWESKFLKEFLKNFIKQYDINPATPLVEFGCGDGRVTELCYEIGLRAILGVDIDCGNILQATRHMPENARNHLAYIAASVHGTPFKKQSLSFAYCSGLPFDDNFFASVSPLFSNNAILLHISSTTLESALLYALVRGDLDEFLRIAETKTRAIYWHDKEARYPLEQGHIIEEVALANGFAIEERTGIPAYASLVFGGLCQEYDVSLEKKELLSSCLDKLAVIQDDVFRQRILVLRKI